MVQLPGSPDRDPKMRIGRAWGKQSQWSHPGQDEKRLLSCPPLTSISLLLTHTLVSTRGASPSLNRVRNLRQTHVGLDTGGLDTQDIRKSFFLLDFPEVEERQRSGQHLVLSWAKIGTEVTQAPGPQYLTHTTYIHTYIHV